MEKNSRILVTGHNGLVGSAMMRCLKENGYDNIITVDRAYCDLCNRVEVWKLFYSQNPEYVINCAARVGGINANNTQGASFIYENLMVQSNVISMSQEFDVKKLLFLGSACIYPKVCPQPIKEDYLMSGHLEKTNQGYAVAKIAGIIMCQEFNKQYGSNFISVLPTNVYGMKDNFNLSDSHVLPAMIRKFHEAKINENKSVEIWGTGTPRREFLYVDDLADALLFLMDNYDSPEIINVGTGTDISIKELAELIRGVVGFKGNITWDSAYPDGTYKRSIDITKLSSLGWETKTSLYDGIKETYEWFITNQDTARL